MDHVREKCDEAPQEKKEALKNEVPDNKDVMQEFQIEEIDALPIESAMSMRC